jgi:hypothetical protein
MVSLRLIVDDVIRAVESVRTDSAKFPVDYIIDLCDQYRAQAVKTIYERTKRIHPAWVQKYVPDFETDIQDDPLAVKFWIPAPISMGPSQNGVIYTGNLSGTKNFKRLLSQSEYATYCQHRNFSKKTEVVLIEGIEGDFILLKVFGNKLLKQMRTDGVWSRPSKLSNFNYDMDMYPLDDEGIVLMKQLIIKSQLSLQEQVAANLKQNEKPLVSIPAADNK